MEIFEDGRVDEAGCVGVWECGRVVGKVTEVDEGPECLLVGFGDPSCAYVMSESVWCNEGWEWFVAIQKVFY